MKNRQEIRSCLRRNSNVLKRKDVDHYLHMWRKLRIVLSPLKSNPIAYSHTKKSLQSQVHIYKNLLEKHVDMHAKLHQGSKNLKSTQISLENPSNSPPKYRFRSSQTFVQSRKEIISPQGPTLHQQYNYP